MRGLRGFEVGHCENFSTPYSPTPTGEKGMYMFVFVNSFEEAEKYPVLFGTTEAFMDNNTDLFYLKSVDTMGKYTMSSYAFQQIENPRPINPQDIASQQRQIAELTAKMDVLLNALGAATTPQPTPIPQPAPVPVTTTSKGGKDNG